MYVFQNNIKYKTVYNTYSNLIAKLYVQNVFKIIFYQTEYVLYVYPNLKYIYKVKIYVFIKINIFKIVYIMIYNKYANNVWIHIIF